MLRQALMQGEFTYAPEDIRESRLVAQRTNFGKGGRPAAQFGRGIVGWVVFVGLGLAIVYIKLNGNRQPSPGRTPPPVAAAADSAWRSIALASVPWLLVFGFMYVIVFRAIRRNRRTQDAALLQPMSLDVSPDGVRLTNGPCETRWQWEAFTRFVETDRQFILYIGDTRTWLAIPKHLADGPADLAAVRELIAARVHPPVEAFPVLPIAGSRPA